MVVWLQVNDNNIKELDMGDKRLTKPEAAGKVLASVERVVKSRALLALGYDGNAVRAVLESALRAAEACQRRLE